MVNFMTLALVATAHSLVDYTAGAPGAPRAPAPDAEPVGEFIYPSNEDTFEQSSIQTARCKVNDPSV